MAAGGVRRRPERTRTEVSNQHGARIGYGRVSRFEQNLDMQITALKKAGCDKIFTDKASGGRADRPGLKQALDYLRPGDTFVVWALDRFARSQKDFANWLADFDKQGIFLEVLTMKLDTRTPHGRFAAQIVVAAAELDLNLIRLRAREGLYEARDRGAVVGRLPLSPQTIKAIRSLLAAEELTAAEIGAQLGIDRSSVFKYAHATDEDIAAAAEIHKRHRKYQLQKARLSRLEGRRRSPAAARKNARHVRKARNLAAGGAGNKPARFNPAASNE